VSGPIAADPRRGRSAVPAVVVAAAVVIARRPAPVDRFVSAVAARQPAPVGYFAVVVAAVVIARRPAPVDRFAAAVVRRQPALVVTSLSSPPPSSPPSSPRDHGPQVTSSPSRACAPAPAQP
jgi:hypothetical protein